MKNKKTSIVLTVLSIILSVACLVLLCVSIFNDKGKDFTLIALFCTAIANLLIAISRYGKNDKR